MGNRFSLVIADRFTKLTQNVPLKRTTCVDVAEAFASHCVFKYVAPKEVLSYNPEKFTSKLYQNKFRILVITNTFTSAYPPTTSGQVERFNRSIAAMLRFYVSYHLDNWDEYSEQLTYVYNFNVHRSTGTRPFDLALSQKKRSFRSITTTTHLHPPGNTASILPPSRRKRWRRPVHLSKRHSGVTSLILISASVRLTTDQM